MADRRVKCAAPTSCKTDTATAANLSAKRNMEQSKELSLAGEGKAARDDGGSVLPLYYTQAKKSCRNIKINQDKTAS